jgi:hypothetical protein
VIESPQQAANTAQSLDETDWYLDPAKIADVVDMLIGEGYLRTPEDVAYVVRKPWKFTDQYRVLRESRR